MSLHHAVIDSQSIIALAIYCNMCTMYSLPNHRCTFGNGVPCHVSHSHRTLHFKWILLFDMFWKDCQSQIKRTRITAKFHSGNEKKICANPNFGQTKTTSTQQISDGKSLVSLRPKIIYGAFYQWKSLNLGIYDNHIENSHSLSYSKFLLLFPIRNFFFSLSFEASPSLFHSISAMTLKQLFQVISHGRLTKVIVIKFYWKPFRYDRMKSALFAHAVCGVCVIITVVERNYLRFNQ